MAKTLKKILAIYTANKGLVSITSYDYYPSVYLSVYYVLRKLGLTLP